MSEMTGGKLTYLTTTAGSWTISGSFVTGCASCERLTKELARLTALGDALCDKAENGASWLQGNPDSRAAGAGESLTEQCDVWRNRGNTEDKEVADGR